MTSHPLEILVVEDDPFLREVFQKHFERRLGNVTVTIVTTCDEGLKIFKERLGYLAIVALDGALSGTTTQDHEPDTLPIAKAICEAGDNFVGIALAMSSYPSHNEALQKAGCTMICRKADFITEAVKIFEGL